MANESSEKLPEMKVCPFCGKKPTLQKDIRYPRPECYPTEAYEVMCSTFGCIIYHVDNNYWLSEKEAIEAWNKRAE